MRTILTFPQKKWHEFTTFLSIMPNVILLVFLIYFLQGVIHNFGHPVTPKLVENMGIDNYYFGLYFAAMSLGLLLGSPIWGVLGDRGHKRTYIVIGLLVYSIGQYMFAFVGNENWMILFRFISGFGVSASVTLILSHLLEHTNTDNRKQYLALYQALFVLGSSLGYYIGGMLPEIGFFVDLFHTDDLRNVFFIQAVLNVVHATYIFFILGKDKIVIPHTTSSKNPFKGFADIRSLDKNLIIFLISLALISLGVINVTKYIEVYMNFQGFSTAEIGRFVGLTGIVSIVATVIIVPFISRLKRDFTMMVIIQFLSAVIIFFVFRSNQLVVTLYTVFMLYIVLKAVYTPLEQNYISSHAKEGEYGKIMGVRQSFFSIGLVIGPLIGGFLYDINALYVFDFSVLMFLFGVVLLIIVGRNIKQEQPKIAK